MIVIVMRVVRCVGICRVISKDIGVVIGVVICVPSVLL